MALRALLQVTQLKQTEREMASKELLADSFEAERVRLEATLLDKVFLRPQHVLASSFHASFGVFFSPALRLVTSFSECGMQPFE
jgi:hypothetical protein